MNHMFTWTLAVNGNLDQVTARCGIFYSTSLTDKANVSYNLFRDKSESVIYNRVLQG